MKPPAFEYFRPASVDEALGLLAGQSGAKPLAGGQSLIPAMNFRLAAPEVLVDLNGIASLRGITRLASGALRLGAMTRHHEIETSPDVAAHAPLLAETMPHIAHPAIRNRGTVGGSLAHADPAAELPAVMVALQATLVLTSRSGERRVTAPEFFTGLFSTALDVGELLTAIELPPPPPRSGSAFLELARRHGDYALVGVAVTVTLDPSGQCDTARIALFSVGDGPVLAQRVAVALEGLRPDADVIAAAADAVQDDIDPPTDIHASAAYRRRLARVLTGRALERAFDRARRGPSNPET
ncbi:MAG TPA: xanthine dehydrogenase family protein subunit M [Gemmatimonadales bacterium]|nr:xanthine dehydrogenase family protein subunit M [Gemmatimonadales bacterium]